MNSIPAVVTPYLHLLEVRTFPPGAHASMIVDNVNVMSRTVTPNEADAPLVVDPNTMLALLITFEGSEPIARRLPHLVRIAQSPNLSALCNRLQPIDIQ